MLKFKFLKGKDENDSNGDPKIEVDGKFFTRPQLIEARQVAVDKLARAVEPEEVNQLAITVAGLESAIEAFEPILKAKAIAHRRRKELEKEDQKAALAGHNHFAECCDVIAGEIMERSGDRAANYMFSDTEKSYRTARQAFFSRLFVSLSYEQADAQFSEISLAAREHRPWAAVVPLPEYKSLQSAYVRRGQVDPNSVLASPDRETSSFHKNYASL